VAPPTPRFSVGVYTTPKLTFAEDLAVYSEAGADGIGIDAGLKLRDRRDDLARFHESGLEATFCFPANPSILPGQHLGGSDDPAMRVQQLCEGIRQLAAFEPVCCTCLTGPQGGYQPKEAREIIVTGLKRVAQVAGDLGLILAIEPMHSSISADWSFLTTIPETVELLDEVDEPNTGLLFDVWHLWDTPDLLTHTRKHASRFVGVHVNDRREPTRSWCDRLLPGDGIADLHGIFRALADGGFDGWFELEIFSDDGTYGDDFPDSLWKLDPLELVRSGREKFLRAWDTSQEVIT
jgi:sugar phosphate isomerase/epimerase